MDYGNTPGSSSGQGAELQQGRHSLQIDSSTTGTTCHKKLWTQHLWIFQQTDWTSTGRIWASTAEKLPRSSTTSTRTNGSSVRGGRACSVMLDCVTVRRFIHCLPRKLWVRRRWPVAVVVVVVVARVVYRHCPLTLHDWTWRQLLMMHGWWKLYFCCVAYIPHRYTTPRCSLQLSTSYIRLSMWGFV